MKKRKEKPFFSVSLFGKKNLVSFFFLVKKTTKKADFAPSPISLDDALASLELCADNVDGICGFGGDDDDDDEATKGNNNNNNGGVDSDGNGASAWAMLSPPK